MHLLLRWIISAVSILVAAYVIPGIYVSGVETALIVALVIGLINAIIRPIVFFLTLPITVLTLGLFTFVINGFLFLLVARIVPGFEIRNLLTAIIGYIVISLVSWFGNHLLGGLENSD